MKKLTSLLLFAVMILAMSVPAFAAEPTEFYVKYGAANINSVWQQMARDAVPTASTVNATPRPFTSDATLEVDGQSFVVHCVTPVYQVDALPAISATSPHNTSASQLQRYVNDNLKYTQTNPDFDAARGLYEPLLSVDSMRSAYVATGRTYTVTGTIGDFPFSTTLKVTSVDADAPDVWIDSGRTVYCTPSTVEYSINRRDWKSIRDGGSLPSSCAGYTIYFRAPSTSYTSSSDYATAYCKEEQAAPTGK